MTHTPSQSALLIRDGEGPEPCAALLTKQLGLSVEVAASRRDGLQALRRREFTVVVVDEGAVGSTADAGEQLWKLCGLAIPLQINFAISDGYRVVREVRAALQRREQERRLAMRAASAALESELRDAMTGLLLHAELALAEPALRETTGARLRTIVQLAKTLRERLSHAAPSAAGT